MNFDLKSTLSQTKHNPIVRILIVDHKGSAPRETGTSMIVTPVETIGTIGGGALELEAIGLAKDILKTKKNILRVFPLGPSLGQCCGGSVTLFLEHIEHSALMDVSSVFARSIETGGEKTLAVQRCISEIRNGSHRQEIVLKDGWVIEPLARENSKLWLYGAGHVGRALVDALEGLAFDITWVDTSLDRFPEDPKTTPLVAVDPTQAACFAPSEAHHIIMTYSHKFDLELCHQILSQPFASIGLIGSATKWRRFQKRLSEMGHAQDAISRIICPIGNPSLGKEPKAIAIGIASQLLEEKRSADRREGLVI